MSEIQESCSSRAKTYFLGMQKGRQIHHHTEYKCYNAGKHCLLRLFQMFCNEENAPIPTGCKYFPWFRFSNIICNRCKMRYHLHQRAAFDLPIGFEISPVYVELYAILPSMHRYLIYIRKNFWIELMHDQYQ